MNNYLKTYSIYQVYVRNFTPEGTFQALINKLDYIKDLGVKIIQLLPVNEIGVDGRKGTLGSPYAIKDYYKINPELGTLEDLKELINEIHKKDMLVILDVVFNHTSRDSVLLSEHPCFFYKNNEGKFANRFGDWSDVYDLDYSQNGLIEYVTDVLVYYTKLGFDGFRFDVASLLLREFYQFAIPAIRKINKDSILLAEAVEPSFSGYIRENQGNSICDAELYSLGFDLLYRYSNFPYLKRFFATKENIYLELYKEGLYLDNISNPEYALKIGTIENHDCQRIADITKYDPMRQSIMAFSFFIKGTGFIYNGQESKDYVRPSLFEKETINLKVEDQNYFNFLKKLIQLKSDKINLNLVQTNVLNVPGKVICLKNIYSDNTYQIGLFNFSENPVTITSSELKDGTYLDLISNQKIIIKNNKIKVNMPLYLKEINDSISC